MNTNIIEGKWKQIKGSAQSQWGKITDDEIDQIQGDMAKLAGLVQTKYGKSKQEAEKAVKKWRDDNMD